MIRLSIAALVFGLCVGSVKAQKKRPPTDDAFLKKVENDLNKQATKRNITSGRSLIQTLLPEIAVTLDISASYFQHADSIHQLGGHDPKQRGFELNAVELSLSKSVDPYFRAVVILNFNLEGVEVEEAYAETLGLPGGLKVRAGLFLSGFGRINSQHSHGWSFVDQPLVLGKFFGGEANRVIGGELSWLTPLPWYLLLGLTVAMPGGEETNRSLYGAESPGLNSFRELAFTAFIKQFWSLTPNLSLLVGFSGAFGPNPTGSNRRTYIYGADLFLKYRPITRGSYFQFTLHAEWLVRQRQVQGRTLTDSGGFISADVKLTKEWSLAVRAEHTDNLVGDYLDPTAFGARQRYSLSLSYWPTEFSRLRLQGNLDHNRFANHTKTAAVMLQLEVTFGSHPAHPF